MHKNEPHQSYGGWKNFLENHCELIETVDGVSFYNTCNCNYIVFPNGDLFCNFGYYGRKLMSMVRERGQESVNRELSEHVKELDLILGRN
jgi:hypothetical protein